MVLGNVFKVLMHISFMGISLDDEEKGVLKYLDTSNNYSSDFDEIKNYLANRGYNLSSRDLSSFLYPPYSFFSFNISCHLVSNSFA